MTAKRLGVVVLAKFATEASPKIDPQSWVQCTGRVVAAWGPRHLCGQWLGRACAQHYEICTEPLVLDWLHESIAASVCGVGDICARESWARCMQH